MLMMLIMIILTMMMMSLMMIMTNQNVSSPECHFKTINRVAPKNKWVSSYAWRGGETTIPRQRLGSPLAHLGHSSLDSVMST